MIGLILSRWREMIMVLLLGSLVYIVTDWRGQSAKIATLNESSSLISSQLKAAIDKNAFYETEALKAVEQRNIADQKRVEVIAQLSKQLNILRNQNPPKECEKAVEWAITQKGDLQWTN